jgi:LysR family transcriptional regulator of abg operon
MTLDPRRLLHLLAVADAGGIGKAARKLGLSQPALSKSLAVLEHALRVTLVDRSRRGASLTPYGELLVERARALDNLIQRSQIDLRRSKEGLDGTITIGVSPVGCVGIVPAAIAQLAKEAPSALITVRELEDDQLQGRLTRGELDVVVSPNSNRQERREIIAEPLFRDRLMVAVSRDNPLAEHRALSLKQIVDYRFALPGKDTAMYRTIESSFAAAGLSLPSGTIFCGSVTLIKSLVRSNEAITLISNRMIEPECSVGWIKGVALKERLEARVISIRWMKHGRPAPLVTRFIDCLRAQKQPFSENAER